MQLPGMSYDPVRLALEVTWFPDEGGYGLSRHLWTRPHRGSTWQLEDMATTGTLILPHSLDENYMSAARTALKFFMDLVQTQGDPF